MREGLGKEVVLCFASKSSGGNESNSEHLDRTGSLIQTVYWGRTEIAQERVRKILEKFKVNKSFDFFQTKSFWPLRKIHILLSCLSSQLVCMFSLQNEEWR